MERAGVREKKPSDKKCAANVAYSVRLNREKTCKQKTAHEKGGSKTERISCDFFSRAFSIRSQRSLGGAVRDKGRASPKSQYRLQPSSTYRSKTDGRGTHQISRARDDGIQIWIRVQKPRSKIPLNQASICTKVCNPQGDAEAVTHKSVPKSRGAKEGWARKKKQRSASKAPVGPAGQTVERGPTVAQGGKNLKKCGRCPNIPSLRGWGAEKSGGDEP